MAQQPYPGGHPPPPRGLVVVGPLLSVSSPLDTQSSRSLPRATTNRGRATRDVPLAVSRRRAPAFGPRLPSPSLRPAATAHVVGRSMSRDARPAGRWASPSRGIDGHLAGGASRLDSARAAARAAPTSESRLMASAMSTRDVVDRRTDRPERRRSIGRTRRSRHSPVGRGPRGRPPVSSMPARATTPSRPGLAYRPHGMRIHRDRLDRHPSACCFTAWAAAVASGAALRARRGSCPRRPATAFAGPKRTAGTLSGARRASRARENRTRTEVRGPILDAITRRSARTPCSPRPSCACCLASPSPRPRG